MCGAQIASFAQFGAIPVRGLSRLLKTPGSKISVGTIFDTHFAAVWRWPEWTYALPPSWRATKHWRWQCSTRIFRLRITSVQSNGSRIDPHVLGPIATGKPDNLLRQRRFAQLRHGMSSSLDALSKGRRVPGPDLIDAVQVEDINRRRLTRRETLWLALLT